MTWRTRSFNFMCSPCKLEHCARKHQHKGGHRLFFDASALTDTISKYLMTFFLGSRIEATEFGQRFQWLLLRRYDCKSKCEEKRTKHHDKTSFVGLWRHTSGDRKSSSRTMHTLKVETHAQNSIPKENIVQCAHICENLRQAAVFGLR